MSYYEFDKVVRPVDAILELARWAPSGDNTQPWRFKIVDDHNVVVYGFDTRAHCVYDLDGHPSQISLGALIETIAIAASAHGFRLDAERREGSADHTPIFDLRFVSDTSVSTDTLFDAIPSRSVQRRAMSTRRIDAIQKQLLAEAASPHHTIVWLESSAERWRTARLMFGSAKLRLTMPEAYRVHREVIEWNARFSRDRVPDLALGVDRATLLLMQFVMRSWRRVRFFNRFFAGTWIPRLQMDLIPAIACGAHFVLLANGAPETFDDYIRTGRATQRFWLQATRLGLMLQPELTPLIFARYARAGIRFSEEAGVDQRARKVASSLADLLGHETVPRAVFMGRLGTGPLPHSRSIRRNLSDLMATDQPETPVC